MTPKHAKSIRNVEPEICPRHRRSNTERKAPANKRYTRVCLCRLQVPNEPFAPTFIPSPPSPLTLFFVLAFLSHQRHRARRPRRLRSCTREHGHKVQWLPRPLLLAFLYLLYLDPRLADADTSRIYIGVLAFQGDRERYLDYFTGSGDTGDAAIIFCCPSTKLFSNTGVTTDCFPVFHTHPIHPCCDPSSVLLIF